MKAPLRGRRKALLFFLSVNCMLVFRGMQAFGANSAPPLLIRNDKCGDNECCNMNLEWTISEPVAVFSKPGHGLKVAVLEAGEKVKVLDAQSVATRGRLQFFKDRGSAKAGQQYYFYDFNNGRSFEFYTTAGQQLKTSSEFALLSPALFKPECKASQCLGEITEPSKGETYFFLQTRKKLKGWINSDYIEPRC